MRWDKVTGQWILPSIVVFYDDSDNDGDTESFGGGSDDGNDNSGYGGRGGGGDYGGGDGGDTPADTAWTWGSAATPMAVFQGSTTPGQTTNAEGWTPDRSRAGSGSLGANRG